MNQVRYENKWYTIHMFAVRISGWLVGVLSAGLGAGLWIGGYSTLGITIIVLGGITFLLCQFASRYELSGGLQEPEKIELIEDSRRNELVRGTSMHLRNMKYRYSIRYDHSDRQSFTADVNSILLGFIPVVILDNHSDKQGSGYVAFPYDGDRWRGPGLPCGGGPEEAVEHAAKCVAPLDEE